ncbi:MAG TPA: phosphatidylglycerophosphatase A [Thermodesulfobacteriota bacterium]|nr:phosphatidylglycerophosphatase A [Thermodesulfobacteriota bacterium]
MLKKNRLFFLLLSTGFGSGYFSPAPGTAGTVVGICFFWCFSKLSPLLYLITVFSFIFLSAWVADGAEKIFQQKDARTIVIDEIAGILVTMLWIPFSVFYLGIGFLIFRILDIVKPFPARWIDRNLSGGWGIVLDDVVAGIYANLILQGIRHWM